MPTIQSPSPESVPEPTFRYQLTEQMEERLRRDFTYHPPKADQPERYTAIRGAAAGLARLIMETTPVSREQSLALTNLEQVVFFTNAAIARNE